MNSGRFKIIAITCVLGFAAPWANANEPSRIPSDVPEGISTRYLACQDDARGAVERAACISLEEDQQDARLNRAYSDLLAKTDREQRGKLVNAQRAWLQSRAKDEIFETAIAGNTQLENVQSSEIALFRLCSRADQIERYLATLP